MPLITYPLLAELLGKLDNVLKLAELETILRGGQADYEAIRKKLMDVALGSGYVKENENSVFIEFEGNVGDPVGLYFPKAFTTLSHNIVIYPSSSQKAKEVMEKLDEFYNCSRIIKNFEKQNYYSTITPDETFLKKFYSILLKNFQDELIKPRLENNSTNNSDLDLQGLIARVFDTFEFKQAFAQLVEKYNQEMGEKIRDFFKRKWEISVIGEAYKQYLYSEDYPQGYGDQFEKEIEKLKKLMKEAKEVAGKEKVEECVMNCNNLAELEAQLIELKYRLR